MNEDRRLILKMLEQGKITADEAAALLEALGEEGEEPAADSSAQEDTWDRLEKQGEEFAHKIEAAAEKFSRSLEDRFEGGVGETLSKMGKMFSRLPFVSGEESYEMMQEYSGWFKDGEWEIPVTIHTVNGRINVEAWDQPHYKIVAVQRVRAKDRTAARSKTVQLELQDDIRDADNIHILPPPSNQVTFSFTVFVPRNRIYDIDIINTNGRVQLDGLRCRHTQVETTNGPITMEHVRGDSVHVSTVNGPIQMSGVEADRIVQKAGNGSARLRVSTQQLDANTTNGSIRVEPVLGPYEECHLNLHAVNGALRCYLPRDHQWGVKVEAETAVGKAAIDVPGFDLGVQERRVGGNRLEGQSRDFADKSRRLFVVAKAGSGSIQIAQKEDGHGKA